MSDLPRVQQADQLRVELESFVGAVLDGTEPRVGGREGLRAVEIAQQIEAVSLGDAATNWVAQSQ